MPLLGALLVNLFGGLAAGIAAWIVKRGATKALIVAGLVAAVAALMTVFNTVITPLVASAFNTQYGQFIGLAFPPAAGTCLAAITTVWGACATYKLRERAVSTA